MAYAQMLLVTLFFLNEHSGNKILERDSFTEFNVGPVRGDIFTFEHNKRSCRSYRLWSTEI